MDLLIQTLDWLNHFQLARHVHVDHVHARDGDAGRQPVWLTHLDENPNGARFLFLADRARSDRVADFSRCFEIFDGRDEAAVAESRERWKAYKAAGHAVVYWQQTPGGGWEKKA